MGIGHCAVLLVVVQLQSYAASLLEELDGGLLHGVTLLLACSQQA